MNNTKHTRNRRNINRTLISAPIMIFFISLNPEISFSQVDTTGIDTIAITQVDTPGTTRNFAWNEFDLGFTTVRIGGGYIMDFVTYSQDEEGQSQSDSLKIKLEPTFKTRDFRFLTSGYFRNLPIQWKLAVMYDGNDDEWLIRESGLVFTLKKFSSTLFIGRTKEGFSMPKIMNGHSPWTMERQMAIDLIPIMADGIRWYVYLPKSRVFGTLAAFNDVISH